MMFFKYFYKMSFSSLGISLLAISVQCCKVLTIGVVNQHCSACP
jgi:hypothetical protein